MDDETDLSGLHLGALEVLQEPVAQYGERLRTFIRKRHELAFLSRGRWGRIRRDWLRTIIYSSRQLTRGPALRSMLVVPVGQNSPANIIRKERVPDFGQRLAPALHEPVEVDGALFADAGELFVTAGGSHD